MLVMNDSDKYFTYGYGGVTKFVPPRDGGTWKEVRDGANVAYEKVSDDPPSNGVYVSDHEWKYLNTGFMQARHSLKPMINVMTEVTGKLSELQAEKARLAKENEEFKARLALYAEPAKETSRSKAKK